MRQSALFLIPFGLMSLGLSACSNSAHSAAPTESFYNPIFEPKTISAPRLHEEAPPFLGTPQLGDVRVKVFPHDGQYSTPHGRESNFAQVSFKSEGECELVQASGHSQRYSAKMVITYSYDDFDGNMGKLTCSGVTTVIREPGLTNNSYTGRFELTTQLKNGRKSLVVVNVVPFEDYIKGVVPSEMPAHWPLESLKAQAVAARTYGANQILAARQAQQPDFFEVDDTVLFQAYKGRSGQHANADQAVDQTQNQFLLFQGRPIIAWFSADSGGFTETSENVWGINTPYTPSKPEIYDLNLISSNWSRNLSLNEIENNLKKKNYISANFDLAEIRVAADGWTPSRRVKTIQLINTKGQVVALPGEDFRYANSFRSSLFTFKPAAAAGALYFEGKGFGHGVGMNQWGAKTLVDTLFWDYNKILGFYFEGSTLTTLAPSNPI